MNHAPPPAWRFQTHDELPSTQDAAIAAAKSGDPGRLAILATVQTAGRGSRGRAWVSPQGNLNLSVLLRPEPGPVEPGRWSLLAAVALHDALASFAPTATLKWPNDVLLDGAKLGGILIDSQMGTSLEWIVIGIGVNLREAPQIEGRPATCLPPPAPAAKTLAHSILARLDDWTTKDTTQVTAAWLDRAHPIGTLLDVRLPQRRLTGTFAGLSPRGELLIAGEASPISSAEIFQ